jgi:hypothetical protein
MDSESVKLVEQAVAEGLASAKVNIRPTHLLLQKSRHHPAKAAIK